VKFKQGTVKTKGTWGILPQEKFKKGEGNATYFGSTCRIYIYIKMLEKSLLIYISVSVV
jgi:hypothetical protein